MDALPSKPARGADAHAELGKKLQERERALEQLLALLGEAVSESDAHHLLEAHDGDANAAANGWFDGGAPVLGVPVTQGSSDMLAEGRALPAAPGQKGAGPLVTAQCEVVFEFGECAVMLQPSAGLFSSAACLGGGNRRRTPKPLVRGVSGAVGSGEVLAVLGPDGSGKEALFGLLAGEAPGAYGSYVEQRTGRLALNGRPFTDALFRDYGYSIGRAPDVVWAALTPSEHVNFSLTCFQGGGMSSEEV